MPQANTTTSFELYPLSDLQTITVKYSIRVFLFLYLLICFVPLLFLAFVSIKTTLSGGVSLLKLAIPSGRHLDLFVKTIGLSFLVATCGTVVGILGSGILWFSQERKTKLLKYLAWLVLLLPPYTYVLCWNIPVDWLNIAAKKLSLTPLNFRGFFAAWWVETMVFAPIALVLSLIGFESIDSLVIDSARVLKDDLAAFVKVAIPLTFPQIFSGWSFIFVFSLLNFSIPSLLLVQTYPLEIFSLFSANNNPVEVFFFTLPLLIVAFLIIYLALQGLRSSFTRNRYRTVWNVQPDLPEWLNLLFLSAITLVAIQIILPFVTLSASIKSVQTILSAVSLAHREIFFTLYISFLTSIFCIPLALATALHLKNLRRGKLMWWFLIIAPFAIPPQLTGIGLIGIWNHPMLSSVYGSLMMPVMGNLARFLPVATLVTYAWLTNIDPVLFEASLIHQPSLLGRTIKINAPILAPGLIASSVFVFILSSGELATTLLVVPPGKSTLTIKIYNYLHYGTSETVAALSFVMIWIVLSLIVIFSLLIKRCKYMWSK